jgi:Rrf2 family iron-sulfur cluster assembly transcriptional regulator
VLVTREADYAVRCVLEVARIGRTSAAQVARMQSISPTFLGKIVQSLAKSGILATKRGVGGGIALAKDPSDITLLQVIEAVGGPLVINECLQSPDACGQVHNCPAYPYLCEAQDRLRESLDVSVASLLDRSGGEAIFVGPSAVSGNGHPPAPKKSRRVRTADPAAGGED